ncbi:hypothetical protein PPOP_1771, partial [Paenibacillus popilliae ATCC 14706]
QCVIARFAWDALVAVLHDQYPNYGYLHLCQYDKIEFGYD